MVNKHKCKAVGVTCFDKKCKGVPWKVDVSRLESALGHEKFKCDKCGRMWKMIFEEGKETRIVEVFV